MSPYSSLRIKKTLVILVITRAYFLLLSPFRIQVLVPIAKEIIFSNVCQSIFSLKNDMDKGNNSLIATNVNETIDSLRNEILVLKSRIHFHDSIYAKVQSLHERLLVQEAKEDYFTSALGAQTGIFGAIITIIIAIVALLGWRWIVSFIKRKLTTFKKEIHDEQKEMKLKIEVNIAVLKSTQFDILKARHHTSDNAFEAILWGLRSVHFAIDNFPDDFNKHHLGMLWSTTHSAESLDKEFFISEYIDEIMDLIVKIRSWEPVHESQKEELIKYYKEGGVPKPENWNEIIKTATDVIKYWCSLVEENFNKVRYEK